jgi:hypothetical protein
MVPLETRANYLSTISSNTKLTAFNSLISDNIKAWTVPDDASETDMIFFEMVIAIDKNLVSKFLENYQKISKRIPNNNSISPYIHDDYLIFAIITGALRYNCNKEWIIKVIGLRARTNTTITFENILNGNYKSTSNNGAIVVCVLNLVNMALLTQDVLTYTYKALLNNVGVFERKNDFEILCSIRAYEIIIELKDMADVSHFNNLIGFERTFLKRLEVISVVFYNICLLITFALLYKLYTIYPILKDKFNDTSVLLSLLGGVSLSNFITKFRLGFKLLLFKLLGYKGQT